MDPRTPEQQDAADRERHAAEEEARLDAPLTRREVLDALEAVSVRYSPYHDSHTIELIRRLIKAMS